MRSDTTNDADRLLNCREAAAYLDTPVATLAQWRYLGRGPAYYRVGGRNIRYRLSDLDAFLSGQRVEPGAA